MFLSVKVWFDRGMRILAWIGLDSSSNGGIFLNERWSNLITSWVLGLMIPLSLAGHVELINGPSVFLSVKVWFDLRVRIFAWVGTDLSKSWLDLVSRWVLGLVVPGL
jgi:hypothetical protein